MIKIFPNRTVVAFWIVFMLTLQISIALAAESQQDPPTPKVTPRVTEARRVLPEQKIGVQDAAGLGHAIRVKVENMGQFLETNKQKTVHLFLNRMEIKGIQPEVIDGEKNEFQFRLLRREALPAYLNDSQQKFVWAQLFGFRDQMSLTREVEVSVGPEGGPQLESIAKLKLIRIRTGWGLLYLIVIGALVLIYRWAFKQGAFRDRGSEDLPNALSLARTQMGFWFFLVIAAFFFIWMVIGELPAIPASVLGLIGIASGTALGAAAIDANKRTSAGAELRKSKSDLKLKEDRLEALKKQIGTPEAQNPTGAEKTQQATALEGEISALKTKIEEAKSQNGPVKSLGSPLHDLLSDANGISFHRLQMAIWTVVLGLVFIEQVGSNLFLPDFDGTLLALMGISAGTYLGFKFPEQQPKP